MPKAAMTPEERSWLDYALDLVNDCEPPREPLSIQPGGGPLALFRSEALLRRREGLRLMCKALIEPLPYLHLPVDERPDNIDYGDDAAVMLRHLEDVYDLLTVLKKAKLDRFRHCTREECGKLFYAHHGNKWTCSPTCGAVVRMRTLRSQPSYLKQQDKAQPLSTDELIARINATPSKPRPAAYVAAGSSPDTYLIICSTCFYQWQTDNKGEQCPRCHPPKPARKNRRTA